MRLLGKGGILYNTLAIVIAIVVPIIAVVAALVGGAIELVWHVIKKVIRWNS